VLAQVTFEATAGEQPGVVAVRGDEHERPGLAVGRARGVNEHTHGDGVASSAFSIKQRKKRAE
jgi:hypothetical protein